MEHKSILFIDFEYKELYLFKISHKFLFQQQALGLFP